MDINNPKKNGILSLDESKRLQLIISGTELGTWEWNILSNKVIFNENYFSMLGFERSDFEQNLNTWNTLLHEDDRENANKVVQEALVSDTGSWETEFRLRTKSGAYHWILGKGKIVERDSNGKPLIAYGIHLNIHDRKLLEEKIKKDLKFTQAIHNTIGAIIIVFDSGGSVIDFNPTGETVTGYKLSEIKGKAIWDIFILKEEIDKPHQKT